jgi:hypothetical protein
MATTVNVVTVIETITIIDAFIKENYTKLAIATPCSIIDIVKAVISAIVLVNNAVLKIK